MAKLSRQRWKGNAQGALPRRDRRPCAYDAYIPDRLVGRPISLDGPVAADVAEAEMALTKLNMQARALSDSEALARLLLRSESVASSKIEGLEIGARRLLRVEAARELGERPRDVTANDVLGNIDAMVHAVGSLTEGEPITLDLLLEAHRRLLAESTLAEQGGCIRTEQNWIGGSSFNPCSAAYVPPPWQLV